MDKNNLPKTSLSLSHKLLIFFGGIFIVLFSGFGYFDKLPGNNKKEKYIGIILYYAGFVFWIWLIGLIYYLTK